VGDVARGEYLVRGIGLCADCRSHRKADGEYDENIWLLGAALPFKPTVEMPAWAEVASLLIQLQVAGISLTPTLSDGYRFGCWLTGAAMAATAIALSSRRTARDQWSR